MSSSMTGAALASSPSPFDLQIQGVVGRLAVRRFRVVERISTPYAAELDLDAALLGGESLTLGARAKLISPRTTGTGTSRYYMIEGAVAEAGFAEYHDVIDLRGAMET